MPVFDAQSQCSASQSCWPVGLDQHSLYCVIGPAAQPAPQVSSDCIRTTQYSIASLAYSRRAAASQKLVLQVHPRPVLSVLDLQATVIGAENEFGRLESQLLCLQTHLAHLKETEVRISSAKLRNPRAPRLYNLFCSRNPSQATLDICACTRSEAHSASLQGLEGSSAATQEQVLDAQDRIDKKLLRMFQGAVKAEKVVRALELASQLSAVRSLEGALKLANHHRCTCLSMLHR